MEKCSFRPIFLHFLCLVSISKFIDEEFQNLKFGDGDGPNLCRVKKYMFQNWRISLIKKSIKR